MNAIFVMSSPFPYGEAFSSRARNLTKLLCCCGYHVHIIAPESNSTKDSVELQSCDYSVTYVRDPKNFITLSGFGTAKPYIEAVKKYLHKEKVDLIISSSMIFVADELYKLSRCLGVPYIIEQCEWYDESIFKFGKWNPYYREHIRRIEKKNKKVDGVIAISRLFEKHYANMGVPTIRIPTVLDVAAIEYRTDIRDNFVIRVVFAGSLGKGKEKLKTILKAISKLKVSEKRICFDIYGPSIGQIMDNIDNDIELMRKVEPYLNIYGHISQDKVEEKVRGADFTIFIRPDRKSSNAGFPTKLAESMAVGTPVITNDTGDIALYLKDNKNGYLLKSGNVQEIVDVFNKILCSTTTAREAMRKNARIMAENAFEVTNYIENMALFLNKIMIGKKDYETIY